MAPLFVRTVQADQVPSGVAVLPLLVSTTIPVPAGRVAVQVAVPHVATRPASNTLETNVPPDAYESNRTQSALSDALGEPLNADIAIFIGVPAGAVPFIVSFRTSST